MPGIRQEVLFIGQVQGVGFRYTACRVAAGYDVAGYVRNTPGGEVECVVEGEKDQVEAFLAALTTAMGGYVRNCRRREVPFSGDFDGFGVRY